MNLSNKAYNVIKYMITIFLPAAGALYWSLWQIWDFPKIGNVNGTINALIAFGGLLIGYSTRKYNQTVNAPDGDLVVTHDPDSGEKYLGLGVNTSVAAMTAKQQVRLNVIEAATDPRMSRPRPEDLGDYERR